MIPIIQGGPIPVVGVASDSPHRGDSAVALATARMAAVAPATINPDPQARPAAYGVPSKLATRKGDKDRKAGESPYPEGHDEAMEEGRAQLIDEEI